MTISHPTLRSTRETGLTENEAKARLAREGANEVPEAPSHPLLRFVRKVWGLSAWMLELIAVLSFVLHKRADLWIALALLVVNAILGFLQEQRASAAVAALRRRLQVTARVLRDASWRPLPARELVSGDVVRVRAGGWRAPYEPRSGRTPGRTPSRVAPFGAPPPGHQASRSWGVRL